MDFNIYFQSVFAIFVCFYSNDLFFLLFLHTYVILKKKKSKLYFKKL